MKLILILLLVIAVSLPATAQELEVPQVINLGTIKIGTDTVFTVSYKNLGRKPVIVQVESSTGRYKPMNERFLLAPQKTGKTKVAFKADKFGRYDNQLTIWYELEPVGRREIFVPVIVEIVK